MDFEEARQFVNDTFEKVRPVHEFFKNFNIDDYEGEKHSVDEIKELIDTLRQWEQDVKKLIYTQPPPSFKAALNLEGKNKKQELSNKVIPTRDRL
mmetsp:Transcript_21169/g.9719  ORF Transcript_21169/g.9719 Transcript_21169/m.9719 type:complete len:95 (+) Transcript_21169:1474-1758(+)